MFLLIGLENLQVLQGHIKVMILFISPLLLLLHVKQQVFKYYHYCMLATRALRANRAITQIAKYWKIENAENNVNGSNVNY